MAENPLIIIPTLNEVDHISDLIAQIRRNYSDIKILVVDGGSDDGTIKSLEALKKMDRNINFKLQEKGTGFGSALQYGFRYAVENNNDPVITMDGDLSHGPEYLPDFIEQAREYDLVIGSRYLNGVRVEGWKFRKLLASKLANMYISYILVKPIWDFTSGFRCYRLSLLQRLNLENLSKHAYIIQIQLLYLAFKHKFRVKEIPFVYRDTENSVSKVFKSSKNPTFWWVLKYRAPLAEILRHLTYVKKDYKRFIEEYDELINPPRLKHGGKVEIKEKYTVSVGVMAYNEEEMISRCLDGLLNQNLKSGEIKQIIVVSSGSTDRTDEIVREYSGKYPIIRLITQAERKGKASAINEFLMVADADIVILESADTTTEPNTVEALVNPFQKKNIGMVGTHPIPSNPSNSLTGYCVNKLWRLHHLMAMDTPKCGEMIAFRNIISKISNYTAVDEAAIESILKHHGFDLEYAADAIVHNKGPETLREFVRQRRRIASGHRHLLACTGHIVSTFNSKNIVSYVIADQSWRPIPMLFTTILIGIEAFSRFVGYFDYYVRDKNPFIWDISKSTKHL